MSLVCTTCRNPVPEGVNQCKVCNNGFVSQLACERCGCRVERGSASCPRCSETRDRPLSVGSVFQGESERAMTTSGFLPGSVTPRGDLVRYADLDGGVSVGDVGTFGAHSDVTVPRSVAELLVDLVEAIRMLSRLSAKLVVVAPTDTTRDLVRGCRTLMIVLQEEVDARRGSTRG